MRELAGAWREAGARAWSAAIAGLLAGLAESAVLVLAVAVAARLADGEIEPVALPLGLGDAGPGSLVALGFAFAAVRLGAALFGMRQTIRAKGDLEARYQRQLLRAYLGASWPEVANRAEGEVQDLISGQAVVAATTVLHATRALQGGLSFACMVVVSVGVDPGVAAITILGAAVIALGLRPVARIAAARTTGRIGDDLDAAALTAETVRLAEELSAFGVGGAQADRADDVIERRRRTGIAADVAADVTGVVYQGLVLLLVLGGLALLIAADVRVAPSFGAILVLLLRAFAYSQQAQAAHVAMRSAAPRRDKLLATTERLAASHPRHGDRSIRSITTCELRGVAYEYPDGQRALDGVDLEVRAGEVLGIAGPSGAGKSTLVQVLLRLRRPSEGQFLVDGTPADAVEDRAWAAAVALVPQEPKLLDASIRENVRFLRPWITDEQLARAALLAGLDDELWGPDGGVDRTAGERAHGLSGGQRQRVAIARALAGEPSLLVLDEPTSALDPECELVIQETLAELDDAVAVVVVSHRSATLRRCDRIVLLRDGAVEAEGTPDELMRRDGPTAAAMRELNAS